MSHLCCSDHHEVQGTHYTQQHGLKLTNWHTAAKQVSKVHSMAPPGQSKAQMQEVDQVMPTNK